MMQPLRSRPSSSHSRFSLFSSQHKRASKSRRAYSVVSEEEFELEGELFHTSTKRAEDYPRDFFNRFLNYELEAKFREHHFATNCNWMAYTLLLVLGFYSLLALYYFVQNKIRLFIFSGVNVISLMLPVWVVFKKGEKSHLQFSIGLTMFVFFVGLAIRVSKVFEGGNDEGSNILNPEMGIFFTSFIVFPPLIFQTVFATTFIAVWSGLATALTILTYTNGIDFWTGETILSPTLLIVLCCALLCISFKNQDLVIRNEFINHLRKQITNAILLKRLGNIESSIQNSDEIDEDTRQYLISCYAQTTASETLEKINRKRKKVINRSRNGVQSLSPMTTISPSSSLSLPPHAHTFPPPTDAGRGGTSGGGAVPFPVLAPHGAQTTPPAPEPDDCPTPGAASLPPTTEALEVVVTTPETKALTPSGSSDMLSHSSSSSHDLNLIPTLHEMSLDLTHPHTLRGAKEEEEEEGKSVGDSASKLGCPKHTHQFVHPSTEQRLELQNLDSDLQVASGELMPDWTGPAPFTANELWAVSSFFSEEPLELSVFSMDHRFGPGKTLPFMGFYLINSKGFVQAFDLDPAKLTRFLFAVERGYFTNPYHCALHAAEVLLSVSLFASQLSMIVNFGAIEELSMYVAAIIHDIRHPGKNNSFLVNTRDPLAKLYNDRSVLENYHASCGLRLLNEAENNFLASLDDDDAKLFRQIVIDLILNTDMSEHFNFVREVDEAIHSSNGLNPSTKSEDLMKALRLLFKLADIGHSLKALHITVEWTRRVNLEFIRQGDAEKQLGLPLSPFSDRSALNVAKAQVGFLQFVVKPLVVLWTELTEDPTCILALNSNLAYWKELQESGVHTHMRGAHSLEM